MNAAAQVDTQREEYGSGAAWVPKVGERVRYNDGTVSGVGQVAGVENDGWLVLVEQKDRHCAYYLDGTARFFEAGSLASAPFRIEAGKFYRTRDGRRVGPMESRDGWGGPFVWQYDRGRLIYRQDGTNFEPGERDLIAEWVDEPTVTTASKDNEAPAKFKVGDRVRALESSAFSVKKGVVYTVTEDCGDGRIRFQKPDGSTDGWYARFFELSAPSNPAIVCLIENGQPKPSTFPHVHSDELSASAEAARLASVHKGQKFGVYVLTQTASEERPAYKHEWQRLAVDGQKIAAIKELRALTGMQLKPAKDVVEHFLYSPYGQLAA